MTREQFERFVDAVENLTRSDLIERAGMWRQDIDKLKATYRKIGEQGPHRERATEVAPDKSAWVSPDPRLLFHLSLDLAAGFVETARQVLSSDEKNLDRAFGLTRPPGRPFDPKTSANLDLAEKAFRLKYECRLSWMEVANRINASRPQPIDERTIRKMIESHLLAICQRRADAIVKRLPRIPLAEHK